MPGYLISPQDHGVEFRLSLCSSLCLHCRWRRSPPVVQRGTDAGMRPARHNCTLVFSVCGGGLSGDRKCHQIPFQPLGKFDLMTDQVTIDRPRILVVAHLVR